MTPGSEASRGYLSLRDKEINGALRIKQEKKEFTNVHRVMKCYTKTEKHHQMGMKIMETKPNAKDRTAVE